MKILLVDDDAFLRDMYATKFGEAGDEVVVAKNAADALNKLNGEDSFDVIVMDMVMPGMTGAELIRKIKKSEKTKDCRCIVLSNQSEQTDIDHAKAAGAVGYIIKAELVPSEVVTKVHDLVK